jgi:hypothetical protein
MDPLDARTDPELNSTGGERKKKLLHALSIKAAEKHSLSNLDTLVF